MDYLRQIQLDLSEIQPVVRPAALQGQVRQRQPIYPLLGRVGSFIGGVSRFIGLDNISLGSSAAASYLLGHPYISTAIITIWAVRKVWQCLQRRNEIDEIEPLGA